MPTSETVNNPELSIFPGLTGDRSYWTTPNGCGCWTCVADMIKAQPLSERVPMPFIVCDLCGNKRCPKATDHTYACTDSNDLGQPGSRYA